MALTLSTFQKKVIGETVVGWKFQLGEKQFTLDKQYICDLFGFPMVGVRATYSEEVRDEFWQRISGMDMFCSLMLDKNIRDGVWRYIHRIVAMSILVRLVGARFVTNPDIDVMISMDKGEPVDWFGILTERFEIWGNVDDNNGAIGGHLFVSMIGTSLGFDLSTSGAPTHKLLDIKQLIHMQMIRADRSWRHSTSVSKKTRATLARRRERIERNARRVPRRTRANPDPTPPSSPDHSPPPPSTEPWVDIGNRISALELDHSTFASEMRSHMRRTDEKLDWIMTTLAGSASHQGFTSFGPPPYSGAGPSTSAFPSPHPSFFGDDLPDDV